jgi:homocitrate synthase
MTRLRIVDSTLREGEQFSGAHFSRADKLRIVSLLDSFGVDCIEMTSPRASLESEADLRAVVALRPRAQVLTHTRCTVADVQLALDCGVDGVNVLFATSPILRRAGHGRGLAEITAQACEIVSMVRAAGREIRFSCEDAFRSDLDDILPIHRAVAACGAHRVGLADTVGIATPDDVRRVVSAVRAAVDCDIEFHGHNDTGCAVANAYTALDAGATHIDTTVLGIGERNGIAALSGLVARLAPTMPETLESYRLDVLPELDATLAGLLGMSVPFCSPITGAGAFSHKAGLHTKAVLNDPRSYEILDPARFGRERRVLTGHRLTGRHAIRHRAEHLGVWLNEAQLRTVTAEVKRRADSGPLADADLDALLREQAHA